MNLYSFCCIFLLFLSLSQKNHTEILKFLRILVQYHHRENDKTEKNKRTLNGSPTHANNFFKNSPILTVRPQQLPYFFSNCY